MSSVTTAEQSCKDAGIGSPLLDKVRSLGLQLPLDLERLALERGCNYYQRDLGVRTPPLGMVLLSNAELAIALIVPSLPTGAREIRLAACLLGGADIEAAEVAALAIHENCVGVVTYIALCGNRFEPDNSLWSALIALLPKAHTDVGQLPHPTRFVEMTGIERGKVGTSTRWIRPRVSVVA